MARNDFVISSHVFFGHLVMNSCLSRTYNDQLKNTVALKEMNR